MSKAINKSHGPTGSLFEKNFKRIEVTADTHLLHQVACIHQNPQKHSFVDDFRDWPYSSYADLLSRDSGFLNTDAVLDWFDGVEDFDAFHQVDVADKQVSSLSFEVLD